MGAQLSEEAASVRSTQDTCRAEQCGRFESTESWISVLSSGVENRMFVNMDEIAIYFDKNPVRLSTARYKQLSACAPESVEARKSRWVCPPHTMVQNCICFLFLMQRLQRNLPMIPLEGMYGCVEEKCWKGVRSMGIRFERIWLIYVSSNRNSVVLLDDMQCHT